MEYELSVEASFQAEHSVTIPGCDPETPHNHDWKATATFAGPELSPDGILLDFVAAEQALARTVAQLQNTDLNTNPAMEGRNPSAEHVAVFIFESLIKEFPDGAHLLDRVSLVEAPGCIATCRRTRACEA